MSAALPLVTIVAVCYNQEKYVCDTLNSVLNQTYPNIQFIIADDGSSDQSKQLISQWMAQYCPDAIFLNHPVNQGVTKNLNSALPYIKGDFYQFIGCEDNMLPRKIETQVNLFLAEPSADIVYSDMCLMDENGVLHEQTHYEQNYEEVPMNGDVYEELIKRCFITTPTALMRTKVLLALGGDNETMEINDYDFWLKASRKFQFLYHDDITMHYRVVPTSLSNRQGIIRFRNNFLVYYYNYDKRQPYREIFNFRLLFNVRNLAAQQYKYAPLYALKAFSKTMQPVYLFLCARYFKLWFTGKNR
jgi:glycosyltransferase involved in cell wall biosynthesis